MNKRTCVAEDCGSPASSRGLCNKHYLRGIRSGDIKPAARDLTGMHSLSDVDEVARTGMCAVCGPVRVRLRHGRRGNECMTKAQNRGGKGGVVTPEMRRRWKYGLTQDELDAFIAAADGRCQICDHEFGDDFAIDHCHETGLVRGVLCRRCNVALGWMDDSPPRLLAAYLYLKASGKTDADWRHRAS